MKRALGFAGVLALCALPAHGEVQLSMSAEHVLTSINDLPTRDDLESAFSPMPAIQGLQSIILDTDANADLGLQLRAIRTLPQFCSANCQGDQAHALLVGVISSYNALKASDPVAASGFKPTLRVRAAIEAIGVANVIDDLSVIVGFLENSSRDIRVTTAQALRNLCNTEAIAPLGARLGHEPVEQVRQAISSALRVLNTCSGS
jgi:hypothetical protein